MPWIRFVTSYTVRATNGAKYATGQEVELSEASAAHFVNAGVAVTIPPPIAGVARPTRILTPVPSKPAPEPDGESVTTDSGAEPTGSAPSSTPAIGIQPRPSARSRAQTPTSGS